MDSEREALSFQGLGFVFSHTAEITRRQGNNGEQNAESRWNKKLNQRKCSGENRVFIIDT